MDRDDRRMHREHKRQLLVQEAVRRADEIILEASDHTVKSTNLLTAELAIVLLRLASRVQLHTSIIGPPLREADASVSAAAEIVEVILGGKPTKDAKVRSALWARVAEAFTKKVVGTAESRLLRWEFQHPTK